MRRIGTALVVAGVLKAIVLGAWWWESVARAERQAKVEPPAAAVPAADGADAGVEPDLFARSRGFRTLLEAVRQRHEALAEREQTVAARETALRALEQTLGQEVARLEGKPKAEAAAPAAPGAAPADDGPTCGVAVTKIYATMKPEEAAPILDRLDDHTVQAIFACMKEKQIGAILAAMNKERAVAMTRVLAGEQ